MRRKYQEVGYNSEVPADFPRQLTVSQRVTARHPVTRQLHDGDVLTIAPDCYRCLFWFWPFLLTLSLSLDLAVHVSHGNAGGSSRLILASLTTR